GMPTKGKRKVLVIPVEFNDCTASSKGYNISNLEKLFNGKGASSSFTSVKDYFYKSSYGQLELEFDIMPNWFKPSNNWSYYRTKVPTDIYGYSGSDSQATGEQLILNEALKSYDSTLNYKDYDSDNNGTIDSVIMIYTKDYDANEDGDSLAWAWRFWNLLGDTSNTYPGGGYEYYYYDECNANDYLWASYKFMFDGGTKGQDLDIYTYCHEFSHVLGLDDYYDTEYIKHPMDGYDMMDAKMGDHCMYSKMALGWLDNVRLITTNSSVTIELKDMEKEGDAILIANNFNDTLGAFQEYWLIQYYTNNGLNAIGNIFPSNGILVYHIDSSVTYESKYEGYVINNNNTTYTNKTGYGTRNNLIEFVPYSSSSNIYKANADLNKTLKDNKGNAIPHTFHIDNISGDTATLTFKKL
ncbi:MAG: hypothetical protein MJ238_07420, partial [Bacilli bacterium]|nr:hypothetical protein [Bacilli bacterium]